MRSPWIDLLFLHHHVTPTKLTWRSDAPPCGCQDERVRVEETRLPLHAGPRDEFTCCA